MAASLQYKCPNCGGAIEFDSAEQKPKCRFCDTTFDSETLRQYDELLAGDEDDSAELFSPPESHWNDEDGSNMRIYVCTSCGGEIICDETTAATTCPYCDNNVVFAANLGGELKPDVVIPFRLTKDDAKSAMHAHFKGKPLLPRKFKEENRIDEIKGIYVPFWLFSADADAKLRYRATRVFTWSDSDFDYTKTEFYSVVREGALGFANVPVDGSKKMPNDLTESVEPFNVGDAVDFSAGYLAGFAADKYDVSAQDSMPRAAERMKRSTEREFKKTVHGYATVALEHSSIRLLNSDAKYALYPIWILNTSWKDKKYTFAVNGQTGKIAGDLPLDIKAWLKWFFGIGAAVGALLLAICYVIWAYN